MWTIFASSSLSITGNGSVISRHEAGPGSSMFRSGPIILLTAVTISSRMASSGGFVTCANSWLK